VRSKVVSRVRSTPELSEGTPGRSSSSPERSVENEIAETTAPASTTGARTAVSVKIAHGVSPTCVRLSRR